MNIDQQGAQIQAKVDQIRQEKNISEAQRKQRIEEVRSSRVGGTDSSVKVVTNVANTMIGSCMIIFPILFIKDGLFSSLIAMLLVCVLQYATCRLLVEHNRLDEPNFNYQIKRILGPKWALFNNLVNVSLLFFVCIGYYLLIVDNLYMVSSSLFTFEGYTAKWASVIATVACVPMIFMKEIQLLLKFFKYTIYCVIAFGLFILVTVIKQIAQGHVDYSQYVFFDRDFSNVAGTFALSFLIHPVAAPILKKNVNQSNNKRDLLFGYGLTAFIYFFVGFIGSLSCAEFINQINNDTEGVFTTVFACFAKKDTTEQTIFYVVGKIVQFGVLVQNLSVMPIIHFLARNQLLQIFQSNPVLRKRMFYIESWAFIVMSLGVAILQIDVSIVLSFDGAIIGFFMAYGIPIYMHLKCYHFNAKTLEEVKQSKIQAIKQSLLESAVQTEGSMIEGLDVNQLLDDENANNDDSPETSAAIQQGCNQHDKNKSKKVHMLMYGTIMTIGVALGMFKIFSFFK